MFALPCLSHGQRPAVLIANAQSVNVTPASEACGARATPNAIRQYFVTA
jgi:hypothetical protein